MKLAKEKEQMTTELKSLAFTEAFPYGQRVPIMREMMIGTTAPVHPKFVAMWTGNLFLCDDGTKWHEAAEVPVKKERPMTAFEIAMLPRGTAFVHIDGTEHWSPRIAESQNTTRINGSTPDCYKGFRLPCETEIRPFTKVEG